MREISREEHEMIFNMFIMAFIYGLDGYSIDHIDDEEWFDLCMKGSVFKAVKICFPMDEVCEEIREVLITPNSTANAGYIYLPANYIKEV